MIAWLSGQIVFKDKDSLIVNVGGIGYRVYVVLPFLASVQGGDCVELFLHMQVREDSFLLFGFQNSLMCETFERLRNVQGIGGKVALAILSSLSPVQLKHAVDCKNKGVLSAIKGVGPKMVERIFVDLKNQLKFIQHEESLGSQGFTSPEDSNDQHALGSVFFHDAVGALVRFGYRVSEVEDVLNRILQERLEGQDSPEITLETMIIKALQYLDASSSVS